MAAGPRISIVGAGVIGLSTALRLCREVPDCQVTVLADSFLADTTSNGAAGLWEPYKLGSTPIELANAWAEETFHHLRGLYDSAECGPAGISEVPCYAVSAQPAEDPSWRDIPGDFRHLSPAQLERFGSIGKCSYTGGYVFTTLFCEGSSYLPWLTTQVLAAGVKLQGRRLSSLQELAGECDVAVNCGGLRAAALAGDSDSFPIRGHVIRVRAPWIKCAYFCNEEFYVLPNHHNVVLGGTGQVGDWDLSPRLEDRDRIWQGCLKMVPSLAQASVEREWVGLRPGRSRVRLEAQDLATGGHRRLRVVHNYGHGGGGITLHWGCAGHAVRLVQHSLRHLQERPRL